MAEQLVFDFDEVWKPIPGYDGYEASSSGRIRSLDRVIISAGDSKRGPYKKPLKGLILSASPDGAGYQSVGQLGRIHILVALTFLGPCPDGLEVRHLDGKKHNNRLNNLTYGTSLQNNMDRIAHGTSNRGERHGMAKLTEREVRMIRRIKGRSNQSIANDFGVTASTIRFIRIGRNWGWLK